MLFLIVLVAFAFFMAGRLSVRTWGTLAQAERIRTLQQENSRLVRVFFHD